MDAQAASRKEREIRIRERQEKAMADLKNRMQKHEREGELEKQKLMKAQQFAKAAVNKMVEEFKSNPNWQNEKEANQAKDIEEQKAQSPYINKTVPLTPPKNS